MALNPILEEIYAVREKLLNKFDNDLFAYVREARLRAIAAGHADTPPHALPNDPSVAITRGHEPARDNE